MFWHSSLLTPIIILLITSLRWWAWSASHCTPYQGLTDRDRDHMGTRKLFFFSDVSLICTPCWTGNCYIVQVWSKDREREMRISSRLQSRRGSRKHHSKLYYANLKSRFEKLYLTFHISVETSWIHSLKTACHYTDAIFHPKRQITQAWSMSKSMITKWTVIFLFQS